jgi:hypothetical protein
VTDLDQIERAARRCGGRPWYQSNITKSGLTEITDCVGGSNMFPITAEGGEAHYIILTNPAIILELIERLRKAEACQN